jgi:hypothetical protein
VSVGDPQHGDGPSSKEGETAATDSEPPDLRIEATTPASTKPSAPTEDILPGRVITRPDPGSLYYAHWPEDGKFYLVQVLGWENLGGHGLFADGMRPSCYVVDTKKECIKDWAERYEDGGTLENDREFPVLFLQEPYVPLRDFTILLIGSH